eukprot:3407433-Rhodomonas_salina.1
MLREPSQLINARTRYNGHDKSKINTKDRVPVIEELHEAKILWSAHENKVPSRKSWIVAKKE